MKQHLLVWREAALIAGLAVSGRPLGAQASTALNLNEQGLAAAAHSDYAQAERLYGEALRIWRSLGPAYEAHAATTLVNLGGSLCESGKWQAAADGLEQALPMNRGSVGPKDIRTAANLNWLGYALLYLGNLDRAETSLAEALAIERERYPDDALVSQTLIGLSCLRRRQERPDQALETGEEALRAALRTEPEVSPGVGLAYGNVAALLLSAGRVDRALPLFRKAHSIFEKATGPDSPLLASLMVQEGLALLEDGRPGLAQAEMTQAAGILVRAGPPAEYRLAVAETSLAQVRLRQKKLAEAERLLTHALSLENRLPSQPAPDLAATMGVLAQLRKIQKRDAESAELTAQAAQIQSRR